MVYSCTISHSTPISLPKQININLDDFLNEKTTREQLITVWQNKFPFLQLKDHPGLAAQILKTAIDLGNCEIIELITEIAGKIILSAELDENKRNSSVYATFYSSRSLSHARSLEKVLQLGAPITNLLGIAFYCGSYEAMASIWENGGTYPEDCHDYTKVAHNEGLKKIYDERKFQLEITKSSVNQREHAWKENVFHLKLGQMFEEESAPHRWPNDILIHLLGIIEQRKRHVAHIGQKLLCPKDHIFTNDVPEGILPVKNKDCTVCNSKVNKIINLDQWLHKAKSNIPLFRKFLNEQISIKDMETWKSESLRIERALTGSKRQFTEIDGQLSDNDLIFLLENAKVNPNYLSIFLSFKNYCTELNL